MKLTASIRRTARVCENCADYAGPHALIVQRARGWVHVLGNSVRCGGQEDDGTDDRAEPMSRRYDWEYLGPALEDAEEWEREQVVSAAYVARYMARRAAVPA